MSRRTSSLGAATTNADPEVALHHLTFEPTIELAFRLRHFLDAINGQSENKRG
jgi:hypothetical protein